MKKNNSKNKMTEHYLDEIERMFRNIDDDTPAYYPPAKNEKKEIKEQNIFLNKKRKPKDKEKDKDKNLIKDPKNFYNDIKELLKNYSLDNDDDKDKDKKDDINKKEEKKKKKLQNLMKKEERKN